MKKNKILFLDESFLYDAFQGDGRQLQTLRVGGRLISMLCYLLVGAIAMTSSLQAADLNSFKESSSLYQSQQKQAATLLAKRSRAKRKRVIQRRRRVAQPRRKLKAIKKRSARRARKIRITRPRGVSRKRRVQRRKRIIRKKTIPSVRRVRRNQKRIHRQTKKRQKNRKRKSFKKKRKKPTLFQKERKKARKKRRQSIKKRKRKQRDQAKKNKKQKRKKHRRKLARAVMQKERQRRLKDKKYRRTAYTGFSTGVAGVQGAAVVIGTTTIAFTQPGNTVFWGPRYYYGGLNCWHYPHFGCWYSPRFSCWYYPWNRCWFYPRYHCWYYPVFGVTIRLEPESKRYLVVENDSDHETNFAVYYREPFDGGYYLYGVGSPQKIFNKETVKVTLPPHSSSKDYLVVVDRDKKVFKQRLIQDGSGKIMHDKDFTQSPAHSIDKDSIAVATVSHKEKKDLNKIKKNIARGRSQLRVVEDKITSGALGKKGK